MTAFLPTEIIFLILGYLTPQQVVPTLTLNSHWFKAVSQYIYNHLSINSRKKLNGCVNLFYETGKHHHHQKKNGFYSGHNYPALVHTLDLSHLPCCGILNDFMLRQLTLETYFLTKINLHNCHTITNIALGQLLERCVHLLHLYIAGATKVNYRALLYSGAHTTVRQLQTLNIYLLPNFFAYISTKKVVLLKSLLNLHTLKLGQLYEEHPDLWQCFTSLRVVWFHRVSDHQIYSLLKTTPALHSLTLIHCKLSSLTLREFPTCLVHLSYENSHEDLPVYTSCKGLETLSLKHTSRLSWPTVRLLFQQSPWLKRFVSPPLSTVRPRQWLDLIKYCPHITHLGLLGISVDHAMLEEMFKAYPCLIELQVVPSVSNNELSKLLPLWPMPCLRILVWNPHVPLEIVEMLPRVYPCLEVVDLNVSRDSTSAHILKQTLDAWPYLYACHGLEDFCTQREKNYFYWLKYNDVW